MNNKHRYILQPYKGISTRHTCPVCGHKGEFALYIDTETGLPLHPSVGRCNRDQKCGYHYTPAEYFKDNPDARPKDDWKPNYVPFVKEKPMHKVEYLPNKYIPTMMQIEKNNLFRFFCTKFGEAKSREVFERYKVGTSKHWRNNGGMSAVFPQIDLNGNLRQLKVIAYNPETGKRLHKEHPAEKLTQNGYVTDTAQDKVWFAGKSLLGNYEAILSQCFFGEHLLHNGNDVAIVESEKTAMIASLYMPNIVWLATGGKNGCRWTSRDVSHVLMGKGVFLYPDLKCLQDWDKAASTLKSFGIDVSVSRYLEERASDEDKDKGLDIGDYLLRESLPQGKLSQPHPTETPARIAVEEIPTTSTYAQDGVCRTIGDFLLCLKELGVPKNRIVADFTSGRHSITVLSKNHVNV